MSPAEAVRVCICVVVVTDLLPLPQPLPGLPRLLPHRPLHLYRQSWDEVQQSMVHFHTPSRCITELAPAAAALTSGGSLGTSCLVCTMRGMNMDSARCVRPRPRCMVRALPRCAMLAARD